MDQEVPECSLGFSYWWGSSGLCYVLWWLYSLSCQLPLKKVAVWLPKRLANYLVLGITFFRITASDVKCMVTNSCQRVCLWYVAPARKLGCYSKHRKPILAFTLALGYAIIKCFMRFGSKKMKKQCATELGTCLQSQELTLCGLVSCPDPTLAERKWVWQKCHYVTRSRRVPRHIF